MGVVADVDVWKRQRAMPRFVSPQASQPTDLSRVKRQCHTEIIPCFKVLSGVSNNAVIVRVDTWIRILR